MTDGGQEATQEPEPITPDNNFPKASFPSSTSTDKPSIYTQSLVHSILTTRIRKFATSVAILLGYRATGGPTCNPDVPTEPWPPPSENCIDHVFCNIIHISYNVSVGETQDDFNQIIDNSQFGNLSRGMYDMDYKWYDFQLKFVLIREYWFVILRLLDDYLLNLWSSEHSDIPYLLMIILFARWKYYSQQVLWVYYTRDKMYRWSFESNISRYIRIIS